MNRQQIFDRITKHLLKQGRKAGHYERPFDGATSDKEFQCQYRSYDPDAKKVLKCAIGCLIPFRNYDPQMEGASVENSDVYNRFPPSLNINTPQDHRFLNGLQHIHDYSDPDQWPTLLEQYAAANGLNASAVA